MTRTSFVAKMGSSSRRQKWVRLVPLTQSIYGATNINQPFQSFQKGNSWFKYVQMQRDSMAGAHFYSHWLIKSC